MWNDPGQEDRLRSLVAQGLSAAAIAREMHITRAAVIGKCDRLGLTLKRARTVRLPRKMRLLGDVAPRAGALSDAAPSPARPSPPRRFSWQDAPA